jgi:putative endonuclease
MEKFFMYILYSPAGDEFYVGSSENLDNRIFRHNNSGSKATKHRKDWVLKYSEAFNTRSEAVKRELEIKRKKSRKYIEWLISSAG